MTQVRAIRGAIQLDADTASEIESRTTELVSEMLLRNDLEIDDLISVIFTCTPDIHAGFPAAAARALGMGHIPLICASELDIVGALPLTIRVMMHANSSRPLREVAHIYLRGAKVLRQDLAQ